MKVVITAAITMETAQIRDKINPLFLGESARLKVSFHESGVGLLASCFSLTKLIYEQKPDLIIQAGIAGAFDENLALGKVVAIRHEQLADTGVEEKGTFNDIFDLNLQAPDTSPFTDRKLINNKFDKLNFLQLDMVTGITINEITTRPERIQLIKAKYNAQLESMEGAALHYCCIQTKTPFIQIRAISNYVGERDKSKWRFKDSFDNLTTNVLKYVDHLYNSKLQDEQK
jgi:futalosine hydrolase